MAPQATILIFTWIFVSLVFSSMILLQSEARPYYISTSRNSVSDLQHLKLISPPLFPSHSGYRSPVPSRSPAWFYFYSPPPPSPPHPPNCRPRFAHPPPQKPPPPPAWFYFYSPPPPNPPHSAKHQPRFGRPSLPRPPRSA